MLNTEEIQEATPAFQIASKGSLRLEPIESRLTLTERLGRSKAEDFERIKRRLVARGAMYEDIEFPAEGSTLYYSQATPRDVVWRRPSEIVADPKFITGTRVRFDVDQHDLGDCWYLSALASVAARPALLENVVPKNQSFDRDYAGIFMFNFWRFGKWERVIIDDRLPYNTRENRLCFCHNRDQPNEFWSALCEKAYAKCFGSYEALNGGLPQDALVDMTGAIGEMVSLKEKLKDSDHLWNRMMASNDSEYGPVLAAGIFAPKGTTAEGEVELQSGLFARHAYSITAVKEVDVEVKTIDHVKLVRVRNPWGDRNEWKGKWSDKSSYWNLVTEENRNSLDLKIEQDGEFWISFSDFIDNFDAVMFAHLTPDTLAAVMFSKNRDTVLDRTKFEWGEKTFEGAWVRGATAGGRDRTFVNPQFRVELSRPPGFNLGSKVPIVVSVMQMRRRLMRTLTGQDQNDLPINFHIFKPKTAVVKKAYRPDELDYAGSYGIYAYDREIAKTFFFDPGVYVVIPSVYYERIEGEFLVRFLTLGPATAEPMEEDTDPVAPVSQAETELLDELYRKYSADDAFVDAHELQLILKQLLYGVLRIDEAFSRTTCIKILECFDYSGNKRINRYELKECWESIKVYHNTFRQLDINQDGYFDASELPKAFRALKIKASRRVVTVLVKLYGTKRGLMEFEGFILAIATLLVYSRRWLKTKDYVFGKITFDQYLLWELNNEIPDIDEHGMSDATDDASNQECRIL